MKSALPLLFSLFLSFAATADCTDDGEQALAGGNLKEAITILEACVETEGRENPRTWLLLGRANKEKGRRGAAISALDEAIARADNAAVRASAHFHRGELRAKRRDYQGATEDFGRAIDARPNFAAPYYARARVAHGGGELDAALADYTRAIDLDPDNAHAYFYRAAIYRKRNLDHLAIADYERAVEIDPNFVRAHANKTFTFLYPLLPVLIILMLG